MSTIPADGDKAAAWQPSARVRRYSDWLAAALTHDYLPGLDPFINWLRQPLGWLVVAAVASSILGFAISPVGWSITAGLLSVIAAGLVFPWFAVRWTECKLVPVTCQLEEGQVGSLQLTVRNPLPVPLFGLTIERFLVQPDIDPVGIDWNARLDEQLLADIGLAQVDMLSQASFQLPICSQYRGRFPLTTPVLACSFPFGIWTARRAIKMVEQVSVHPRRVGISGMLECIGRTSGDTGLGDRAGGHGDLLGVRDYRRGDSMRTIHWAQTAKLNSIVVCERGAPEKTTWQIQLDCQRLSAARTPARQHLAWRVRIAASLAGLLSQQSIPFQLVIPGEESCEDAKDFRPLPTGRAPSSLRSALDRLTDIPLDGFELCATSSSSGVDARESTIAQPSGQSSIIARIAPLPVELLDQQQAEHQSAQATRFVHVVLQQNKTSLRSGHGFAQLIVDLEMDVAEQLSQWMQRVSTSTGRLGPELNSIACSEHGLQAA